jgi:DNA-binding transcriptional ArsR family regulator
MLDQHAVDRTFQALAEPARRAIVERLSYGPASVADLAEPLDITLAAVLQHVQALERSGLIRTEKVGRVRTCRIDPEGLRVAQAWIDQCRTLWERRFDRLGAILAEDSLPEEEGNQ